MKIFYIKYIIFYNDLNKNYKFYKFLYKTNIILEKIINNFYIKNKINIFLDMNFFFIY